MSKLPYRVIYCSGEDPQYPVTELDMSHPHARGWCTPKFCDFPQELILQFTIPPSANA